MGGYSIGFGNRKKALFLILADNSHHTERFFLGHHIIRAADGLEKLNTRVIGRRRKKDRPQILLFDLGATAGQDKKAKREHEEETMSTSHVRFLHGYSVGWLVNWKGHYEEYMIVIL